MRCASDLVRTHTSDAEQVASAAPGFELLVELIQGNTQFRIRVKLSIPAQSLHDSFILIVKDGWKGTE